MMDNKNWDNIDVTLQHIIKNRDFGILTQIYPDRDVLKDIISNSASEAKRDSLLAMVVKYGDAPFLNKFMHTYFPDNSKASLDIKEEFLNGLTSDGERLNYHYFHGYLPEDITRKADVAFGIKREKNKNVDDAEKKRLTDLYNLIKKHKLEVELANSPYHFEEHKFDKIKLSKNENPSSDKDGELDFPVIALCNVPKIKMAKDYVVAVSLPKIDDTHKKMLKQRVYKNIDFPEDFIVQAGILSSIESEWGILLKDDHLRPVGLSFINSGGIFRIDNDQNLKRFEASAGYNGYAGNTIENRPFAAIHALKASKNGNTLTHEVAHMADLHGYDIMSDNTLVGYAFAFMVVAPGCGGLREHIVEKIAMTYNAEDHRKEVIANLMQYARKETATGYPNDRLLRTMYKLFGKFSEAKTKDYKTVLNRIETIPQRIENASDLGVLVIKMKPYLEVLKSYGDGKVGNSSVLGVAEKLRNALSKSRFNDKHFQTTENQFCEDLIRELKQINQIIRDKDAVNIKVPSALLGIKSSKAIEVIYSEAGKEYSKDQYLLPREHLDKVGKMYGSVLGNIKKLKKNPEELNNKCLEMLIYADKVTHGKVMNDFTAKDFDDSAKMMEKVKIKFDEIGVRPVIENTTSTSFISKLFKRGSRG